MSFITKAWAWLTGAAKKVKAALNIGRDVANDIKKVVDSPLLDVAVNLTKSDLDNKALAWIRAGLGVLIENIGWADKKLSDFTDESKPYVLATIAAEASVLIAQAANIDLTRQQAITAGQLVYDEKSVLK